MPFFIKHCPIVEWEVVVVEAETREAALDLKQAKVELFLGSYRDGSQAQLDEKLFGPFTTKEEALSSGFTIGENPG